MNNRELSMCLEELNYQNIFSLRVENDFQAMVDFAVNENKALPKGVSDGATLEADCEGVLILVNAEKVNNKYKEALKALDPLTSHWIQHNACGETERAERAKKEIVLKRLEIEAEFFADAVGINEESGLYHSPTCQHYVECERPLKTSEAVSEGYSPCNLCNP